MRQLKAFSPSLLYIDASLSNYRPFSKKKKIDSEYLIPGLFKS